MCRPFAISLFLLLSFAAALPALGADTAEQLQFFEKRIRPVLIQSCYRCHSDQTEEPEAGLRLDTRAALRQGGDSGPALVPGEPAQSLLIEALRYESLQMPPSNQLPAEVIADFEYWIRSGAADPRDRSATEAAEGRWPTILAARRDWWSLQPVTAPPLPATHSDWPLQSLDRFILDGLTAAGLEPAPSADPHQLVRRVSLVLTGLPPTVSTANEYFEEQLKDPVLAYSKLVDRLLNAPQFGERWARHWMDVVRFTETHGNEWNYEVHHAWRYRDYLVRAFNTDVRFDAFVREHIAGDLIPKPRWNDEQALNESLIGTAFYRFGEVNHDDCVTLKTIGYDILDNQIDTLTKAFQATTVACARCHDHKIDAVSMNDYYALLGILKSSRLTAHTLDAPEVNLETIEELRDLKDAIRREIVKSWTEQAGELADYWNAASLGEESARDFSGLQPQQLERVTATLQSGGEEIDDPLWAWRQTSTAVDFAAAWGAARAEFVTERDARRTRRERDYTTFADFRQGSPSDWRSYGQGLRDGTVPSGELAITADGEEAVAGLLLTGLYTHRWSQKLNGTLRSPLLPSEKAYVSLLVLGDKTSAVRLVSNNCQLNYANYRALTSPQPTWVTFKIPDEAAILRTFAEVVTKFDNPKFPDQLGTLGGDRSNARVPWSEAAADPRSYFGIMKVMIHDDSNPPDHELSWASRLFSYPLSSQSQLSDRYTRIIKEAVATWAAGKATDDDVVWLNWASRAGLLNHQLDNRPNLARLVRRYRQVESELRQPRLAPGLADFGVGRDHPRLERGNPMNLGHLVPRRYLQVLSEGHVDFPSTGSGRWELAEAITRADNPLTARVIVNRVWHHVFGTGIVRTVDDFGRVGELPSHPALLDYLAARFVTPVADGGWGWSIKLLLREIVTSRTFCMSSHAGTEAKREDPENRLLHCYPTRRMEAEAIRDSILAVAGSLKQQMYGESVQPYREESNATRRIFAGPLDGNGRRSVYIKTNLMESPSFLGSFNVPGGKVVRGRRDNTNVPAQALTLLNDAFVLQQAEAWAQRMLGTADASTRSRLAGMFERALHRPPSERELKRLEALVERLCEIRNVSEAECPADLGVWTDIAHVLFNLKEFIYIP